MATVLTTATADGTEVRYIKVKADKRGRTVKCPNKAHTVSHPEYPESFVKHHASWCRDANPSLPEKSSRKASGTVEERMAASTIGGDAAAERAGILRNAR